MTDLAKSSLLLSLARAVDAVVAMAGSVLLARMLGPAGRGHYALLIAIVMLLEVPATLGVTEANVYLASTKSFSISNYVTNSALFAAGSSAFWVLVFLLVYGLGAHRLLSELSGADVLLALAALPCALLFIYLQNVLLGIRAVGRFIGTYLVLSTSSVVFLSCCLWDSRLSLREAVSAYVASYAAACGYAVWCCAREAGGLTFAPSRALALASIRYGTKSTLGTNLLFVRDRLETLIVSYFLPASAVGHYAIAQGLADRLRLLPKSVSYVLFAEVARSDSAAGGRIAAQLARNTGWLMTLIVIPLILASRYIILILYGPGFLPAQLPLSILLGSTVLSGFIFSLGSLALGRGAPKIYASAAAIGFVTTVVLDVWLIPRLGLAGAAAANVSGLGAMAIFYARQYTRDAHTRLGDVLVLQKDDWQAYSALAKRLQRYVVQALRLEGRWT